MLNKKIDLYIGLGNIKTDKVEDKEVVKKRIVDYLKSKGIAYSFTDQIGGYVYNSGHYIIEDSLKLTLIGDYSKSEIKNFVDLIKSDYIQDTVLVNIIEMDVKYE